LLEALKIIDVSNVNDPTIVGTVESVNPEFYIIDNYVFTISGGYIMSVIDITDPSTPFLTNFFGIPFSDVLIGLGNFLYIAGQGVHAIDVTDVYNPKFLNLSDKTYIDDLSCDDHYLAASSNNECEVDYWDISNQLDPVYKGLIDVTGPTSDVEVINDILLVRSFYFPIEIYNLQAPSDAMDIGTLDRAGQFWLAKRVDASNCGLIIGQGIYVIDFADPGEPAIKAWKPGLYKDAASDGQYIYAVRQDTTDYTHFIVMEIP